VLYAVHELDVPIPVRRVNYKYTAKSVIFPFFSFLPEPHKTWNTSY